MAKGWRTALRREFSRVAARLEATTWRRQRFVLYRIIGNDLPPRHQDGQSLANLRFVLENEPPLPGCEKRWIVNRIVDPARRDEIETLLRRHGQDYVTIAFDADAYRMVGWDLERVPGEAQLRREDLAAGKPDKFDRIVMRMYVRKNLYVMNNNGARNAALRDGRARGRATWVLPWDGNCFVTAHAWTAFRRGLARSPWARYCVVPMARVADNDEVLGLDFAPPAQEEPQLAFRRDAPLLFDEAVPYGRRPKVDLLMRLGVAGPWDSWKADKWDDRPAAVSPEASRVVTAGWVARLAAGTVEGVDGSRLDLQDRGRARNRGIRALLDGLDETLLRRTYDPARPLTIDPARLSAQSGPEWRAVREALCTEAAAMLRRGPFSVMGKSACAPSGDKHDYFSLAPYYWPNPDTAGGLPYVRRDGQRAPGMTLHEPGSEAWDRSALHRALTDPVIAALAFLADGHTAAAEHGASVIRTWFVDPATRMNPNMTYAQVRRGHHRDVGFGRGTIEIVDLAFLLDAARIFEAAGALDQADAGALRAWCRAFRRWLQDSPQGARELTALNNHGTGYELLMLGLAAYLDDPRALIETVRRSQSRLLEQFRPDGSQPYEEARTLSAGYHCFNLQLWIALAGIAEGCGLDLAHFAASDGRSLAKGLDYLGWRFETGWPHPQIARFDPARLAPLRHARQHWYGPSGEPAGHPADAPFSFPETTGIRPFWALGSPFC